MDRSEVEQLCINYNKAIDDIIEDISKLKITEKYSELRVQNLYNVENGMSVVNNITIRRKLEKLLEDVRNGYGWVLEDEVNQNNKNK